MRDVAFGERVKIVEPCNLYGCKLGDDCFVGPFTEIQKGVAVGARTRVQSHAFICELVTIGEDCFVGHGVMFVNDTFSTGGPARGRKELWREKAADIKEGYSMTVAPLVADGVVITGISGAEFGTRGFIDGWDPATGKKLWRTYTIPTPDEPGGDTWKGDRKSVV